MLYQTTYHSPFGKITLLFQEDFLIGLEFSAISDTYINQENDLTRKVKTQLDEYFAKKRQTFDLPLLLKGTPFQIKVWEALKEIPYGETWSYKMLASAIGQEKAYRAVGNANNKNPISIIIPCHRVIGSDRTLVGYGGGLKLKKQLLDLEKKINDI